MKWKEILFCNTKTDYLFICFWKKLRIPLNLQNPYLHCAGYLFTYLEWKQFEEDLMMIVVLEDQILYHSVASFDIAPLSISVVSSIIISLIYTCTFYKKLRIWVSKGSLSKSSDLCPPEHCKTKLFWKHSNF